MKYTNKQSFVGDCEKIREEENKKVIKVHPKSTTS